MSRWVPQMCPLLSRPDTSIGRWIDLGFSSEFEITLKLNEIRADCKKCKFIVLLYSTFDVLSNYLSTLRVKLLVKKYEPRFIVALWLAWGDEAIGTYTVNSAFNESVCLLSWRYCYVWSAEKLYAWTLARSKSVKEVLTYLSLSQDFFLSFFFFPISRKKRYV